MSPWTLPEAALAGFTAVVGKTGSGKTSVEKLIIEQVVASGARVCILDPIKSDHWGLTSSADGKRPGLPFHILGGPHGHVPLHSSAGTPIAELVASGALPLSILDMRDFEPGGLQRFFVDFAPTLLRKQRGVLYLVIEEAHLFAPKERTGVGAENLAVHHAKTLATAGRSQGLRLILATQRTQSLHNALLGSCETMVAMRLTLPADQKPVVDWLKANTPKSVAAAATGELAALETGTGWLCSAAAGLFERVAFPRIATYDNSATPMGESDDRKVKRAPVDLEKLRSVIGDAVRHAEANDPTKLKARVAALEKQLAGAKVKAAPNASAATVVPDEAALAAAEKRGFARGLEDGLRDGRTEAQEEFPIWYRRGFEAALAAAKGAVDGIDALKTMLDELAVWKSITGAAYSVAASADLADRPAPRAPPVAARAEVRPSSRPVAGAPKPEASGGLNSAARKMLAVLDTNPPVRRSWQRVATLAGLKARGGHFNAGRRALVENGLVAEAGALVAIAAPSATAGPAAHDPAALVETWARTLSGPAPAILKCLFAHQRRSGGGLSRAAVAEDLGLTPRGGHWNAGWKELRENGLVTLDGEIARLSDLFAGGGV